MHKLPPNPYITPVRYEVVNGETTVVEDANSTIYYISMYPYTNKAYGGMTVETTKLTSDSYKIVIRNYTCMNSPSNGAVGAGTV